MEKEVALALINKFKKVKKPGSSELISIPLKFIDIRGYLKLFFKDLSPKDADDIRQHIIDENGYKSYSPHFLVVISSIANILGVSIYMTERLENDIVTPAHRLIIVGQKYESSVVAYLGKYLLYNEYAFYENLKINKPKRFSGMMWQKQIRLNFYIPILTNLKKYKNLRNEILNPIILSLRNKYVLEYLINNFIFDFNDKNINPQLKEHGQEALDRFKVSDGKWKNKHLLH